MIADIGEIVNDITAVGVTYVSFQDTFGTPLWILENATQS